MNGRGTARRTCSIGRLNPLCLLPEYSKLAKSFQVYLYGPDGGSIPSTFESAEKRLTQISGLHFEPDGSFVWSAGDDEQIDGMIYDAAGVIQYVDLQGHCRLKNWRRLLAAIHPGLPDNSVVIKLPQRMRQSLKEFEESSIGTCFG